MAVMVCGAPHCPEGPVVTSPTLKFVALLRLVPLAKGERNFSSFSAGAAAFFAAVFLAAGAFFSALAPPASPLGASGPPRPPPSGRPASTSPGRLPPPGTPRLGHR